jgi:tetratricopeptide (TPR) repeat protein
MKKATRYLLTPICVCLLTVLIFHPLSAAAQQTGKPPNPWLIRSRTITDEIIADSAALSTFDRAIVWAQLGAAWWKDDKTKARGWMLEAVEAVESIPSRETIVERHDRLATARTLLSLISMQDEKLAKRLEAVFTSGTEGASETERRSNADALLESALAVLDSNPKRAAELGAAALHTGKPTRLIMLLWGLRDRDDKLADALFADAIVVAEETSDLALLATLSRVAFPELESPASTKRAPSVALRRQLLLVLASYLERTLRPAEGQPGACVSLAPAVSVGAPLLPQFERLTPQESRTVRQLLLLCQPAPGSLTEQRATNAMTDQSTWSVDDWLKAADQTTDLKVKTVYQMRAAQSAIRSKNYERALDLLDGMDDDARKFLNRAWEGFRWEWAAQLASDYVKRDDIAGMRRVIAAVPASLRPFAQIALADAVGSLKHRQLIMEILDEARKGLSQSDEVDSEKVTWSMSLVRLYIKFQSRDRALSAFQEAVSSLNRANVLEREAKETRGIFEHQSGSPLTSSDFPASLLEAEEYAVRKAVFSIDSPFSRTQARLGMLKIAVDQSHRSDSRPKVKAVAEAKGLDENQ